MIGSAGIASAPCRPAGRAVPSMFFDSLENHFGNRDRIASGGAIDAWRLARSNRVHKIALFFLDRVHRLRIACVRTRSSIEDMLFPIRPLVGR